MDVTRFKFFVLFFPLDWILMHMISRFDDTHTHSVSQDQIAIDTMTDMDIRSLQYIVNISLKIAYN